MDFWRNRRKVSEGKKGKKGKKRKKRRKRRKGRKGRKGRKERKRREGREGKRKVKEVVFKICFHFDERKVSVVEGTYNRGLIPNREEKSEAKTVLLLSVFFKSGAWLGVV